MLSQHAPPCLWLGPTLGVGANCEVTSAAAPTPALALALTSDPSPSPLTPTPTLAPTPTPAPTPTLAFSLAHVALPPAPHQVKSAMMVRVGSLPRFEGGTSPSPARQGTRQPEGSLPAAPVPN